MQILEVNFDEIQKAMEDVRRDRFDYYLDKKTGKVVVVSGGVTAETLRYLYDEEPGDDCEGDVLFDSELDTSAELPDQLLDRFEELLTVLLNPERYIRIPERDSSEAFACMQSFAEKRTDDAVRKALLSSLQGKKAFKGFKDQLKSYPEERKRWNRLNAQEMRSVIKDWLTDHGITSARKRKRTVRKCA